MEAAEAKVQRILEGVRQFLVPHFQRPYSWREKQWVVLWRDLMELIEDPESKPHFLGSLVSSPARSVPEGVEKRLLIDGQQRLTTILILLALVRDQAKAAGNAKLADKVGDLVINRHEDGQNRYKLLPTQNDSAGESDRDAFIGLIEGRGMVSTSGIEAARTFFSNKLQRADAPNPEALFRVLTSKLTLISIVLDEKDNPHRIFESLNGKGRPLSQADLIRNYFFMRLPEHEHETVYRSIWQPMQKRLGEETLTEFIRHYLMHFGQVVNAGDIYTKLEERMDGQSRSALEHLEELAAFSRHYEILIHPEKAPSPALAERLGRLQRLEVTVAYPFLLPAYADFARGALSEASLCAVLDVIETYVVRRLVCGVATRDLGKIFGPLYQQARKRPDFLEAIKGLLSDRACPRDAEFSERLRSARLYGGGERRAKTKLLLERLEVALGHEEQVKADTVTIEHVMPQILTPWWKEHLGEDWEDDHETLLHTLGNLTLTSYSAELSNATYPEKRLLLAKSHVELNGYFADIAEWSSAAMERRADTLTDVALSVWPFFGGAPACEEAEPHAAITSTLPRLVVFRGTEYPVLSWADVLVVTMEQIITIGSDEFLRVEQELGRLVSHDPIAVDRFRRPHRLSNGAHLEKNHAAPSIHRLCLQALQVVGLGPDEWRVEYGASTSDNGVEESTSEVKQLQLELWEEVRRGLDATGKFPSLQTPRPQYWFAIAVGRSGFWLSLDASVMRGQIAVKLVISDGVDATLQSLLAQREAVDEAVGFPLEWDPHPGKRQRTVRLIHALQISDRTQWPEAIDWFTRTSVAFKEAFAPRIAALRAA